MGRVLGTLGVGVLAAGSLVVASATPSAAASFAFGHVHCTMLGKVQYFPRLLPVPPRDGKTRFIADLSCTTGETGLAGVTVLTGRMHGVTTDYLDNCTTVVPPLLSAQIHWRTNGVLVRDTYVAFQPVATSTNPYSYEFAGASSVGSYSFEWVNASFVSDNVTPASCTAKLGLHHWLFTGLGGLSTLDIAPVPTVSDASPNSLNQGAANTDITVDGTNFTPGSTVSFTGLGVNVNSTTYVSPTQLIANVSIDPLAELGSRDVTVTEPSLANGTCEECFSIGPAITSIAPPGLGQGAVNQNVVINGTGFQLGASAAFSGAGITVNSTTFVNSAEILVNVSIASNAPVAASDVTITNPDTSSDACASCFNVDAGPAPTNVLPSAVGQGATRNVAIFGSNFVNGAVVTFSGPGITVNSATFVSPSEIDANISVDPNAVTGPHDVTVNNPDAGTGTCGGCLTIDPAPVVTGVSPTTLKRHTGDVVTITGFNFQPGATVAISGNGIAINSLTYNSSTQLTIVVSIMTGATETSRSVTVTNPDGGMGGCAHCLAIQGDG